MRRLLSQRNMALWRVLLLCVSVAMGGRLHAQGIGGESQSSDRMPTRVDCPTVGRSAGPRSPVIQIPAGELKKFEGAYAVEPEGGAPPGMPALPPLVITRTEDGQGLHVDIGVAGAPKHKLVPVSPLEFVDESNSDSRFSFAINDKGEVTGITLTGVAPFTVRGAKVSSSTSPESQNAPALTPGQEGPPKPGTPGVMIQANPGGGGGANPWEGASCYEGKDLAGANYYISVPADWSEGLVLFGPGGPDSLASGSKPVVASRLKGLFEQFLPKGYAVAVTAYSRQGWSISTNAADMESLRRIFVKKFGRPKRTILFSGSYAGEVVAKTVEKYGVNPDGTKNYDGALIHSGILGGVSHYFEGWLDVRIVYQYYCHNYPSPDETQYPLYLGLPLGAGSGEQGVPGDLISRAKECFGYGLPDDQRTAKQKQIRDNLLRVLRLTDETGLVPTLALPAGAALADFNREFGGYNAIANDTVHYQGSSDDKSLNAGVERYRANAVALQWVKEYAGLTGDIPIPVLTMHTMNDPIVLVENDNAYRDLVKSHGMEKNLLQLFVDDSKTPGPTGHMAYTTSESKAGFDLLLRWINTGIKPTPAYAESTCEKNLASAGDHANDNCRFASGYFPKPLSTRVYPR